MINRINVFLLSFILIFAPIYSYAGAAEKWEYDVIPDQSQTLKVKGHKVDQYGSAVNDYDYNTKIDPKTAANRTKMGTVGMGRLLKTSGWGLLGAAALQALLDSVGWIMDPESQSIWRNKKPDPNGSTNCGGGYLFRYQTGEWKSCPIDAIQPYLTAKSNQYVTYTFVRFDANPFDPAVISPTFTVKQSSSSSSKDIPGQTLQRKPDPNAQPEPKEILTPEALADYANHTHPDYSNPELAPKLEPKYSPEIQTDLWKPSNPWEDTNSPTVQEVKKELEKAPPEPKKDPELTPNPETGGFAFPAFCSWAAPVCEFVKWVKTDDVPEKDNEDLTDKNLIDLKKVDVKWAAQCPEKEIFYFELEGYRQEISILNFEYACQFSPIIKSVVLFGASLEAIFILSGIRRNGADNE